MIIIYDEGTKFLDMDKVVWMKIDKSEQWIILQADCIDNDQVTLWCKPYNSLKEAEDIMLQAKQLLMSIAKQICSDKLYETINCYELTPNNELKRID